MATRARENADGARLDAVNRTADNATVALKAPLASPTLVTPALGTPASGVMTNMTGAVTASLVDDAVTLAKMASGTDGNIISYDASGNPVAIATGSDGQVLTSTGAGSPPAFEAVPAGGITHAGTYRVHTGFGTGGEINPVVNWEKDDSFGPGFLGADMSESSGVFTFPATGMWRVDFHSTFYYDTLTTYVGAVILNTTDNSTYNTKNIAESYIMGSNGDLYSSVSTSTMLDISSVSNCKVKFMIYNTGTISVNIKGDTNQNLTYAIFTRLGDT
jgi:hypothetical protein